MKATELRVFACAPAALPVPIDKFHHDNTFNIKKFRGANFGGLVSLGEGHLFRQGSCTEMSCLSSYNLLKMHVHIFTCKLKTTKPLKAKVL
jgi:hypothetical protein